MVVNGRAIFNRKHYKVSSSLNIIMSTLTNIGSVAAIVVAFFVANGFLYTIKAQTSDYFLTNSLLLIIGYLTYLTKELNNLKTQLK